MLPLIVTLLLVVLSFALPALAVRYGSRRLGPVPDIEHLTEKQQGRIRRRFVLNVRFWVIVIVAFVLATGVSAAIYALPSKPGLIVLATMLGVPYVVGVAAVLYLVFPLWHRVVTDELMRLDALKTCPGCGYDLTALTADICPECETRVRAVASA